MAEEVDDVPNVLILYMLALLICTYTGNYDNGVSSMIVMALFNYLKINFSATKTHSKNTPAGGGARG